MHYIESSDMGVDENGNPCFVDGPPGTKINAAIMNSLVREITHVIEQAGLTVLNKGNDTHTQLWQALQVLGRPYDYIVSSQTTFNNMIERVGANQYRIKSAYRSIFVKQITGGYNCTSWLSGGDSWGYIESNQCGHIEFESGAYINDSSTPFYLRFNTNNGYFSNIRIKGGGAASAIQYSFYNDAKYCTYKNCGADGRITATGGTHIHFYGDSTQPEKQETSKLDGCYVINDNTQGNSTCYAFYDLYNLNSCFTENITVGTGRFYAYSGCNGIANTVIGGFTGGVGGRATFFSDCRSITGVKFATINCAGTGYTYLFSSCHGISGVDIYNVTFAGSFQIFSGCRGVSGVNIGTATSTGGHVTAFNGTYSISGVYISTLQHTGGVASSNVFGFYQCRAMSGIDIGTVTTNGAGGLAEGITQCYYAAAVDITPTNNSMNDWIDTLDATVVNRASTPSVFT